METGTLKELNAQPGDVVEVSNTPDGTPVHSGGVWTVIRCASFGYFGVKPEYREGHKGIALSNNYIWRIVSRANAPQPGPVRTVTRKEIVPGVYGKISVFKNGGGRIGCHAVELDGPTEIRAAIATLTEIADALEDR